MFFYSMLLLKFFAKINYSLNLCRVSLKYLKDMSNYLFEINSDSKDIKAIGLSIPTYT